MAKHGRPSTYRREWADSVLEWVASGKSMRSCCESEPGRPSKTSIIRWRLADIDGFGKLFREARLAGAETWADELVEIADESVGEDMAGVQAQKLRVDVRKWLLARLHPEDYGERLPAHDTADTIRKTLQTSAIKDIMDQGLHEYLEDFVTRNNQLGMEISDGYRFYV